MACWQDIEYITAFNKDQNFDEGYHAGFTYANLAAETALAHMSEHAVVVCALPPQVWKVKVKADLCA